MTYSATQALNEALTGLFSLFIYPPDVLEMREEDRIKVTTCINRDDAPALAERLSRDRITETKGSFVSSPTTNVTPIMSNTTHFAMLTSQRLVSVAVGGS